ncbi:hypothetical protein [Actinomadura rubrisoli]|uniref:Uncharacterized protein n=1 Tax=Actinomadura rubrisoli TaxID=2530368 RepID=A0A4R4ZQT9_9ACTN|nr:hypothetical protein [Actinomadura rubrisoli]TDD61338.1 hypothetical protein E1298_45420 [Actinomadura rubrisoli]
MQQAMDVLAKRAEDALRSVRASVDDATLTGTVDALESLTNVIEVLHQLVSAMNERAAQIGEREVTERRDGTALKVMDTALAHLAHGRSTAVVAHHLLATGRYELARVAEEM